eukprot:CCRYP_019887-RA/>CCRYP_019887-RA protein AED:0.38 eAED:0.38 QI:0/-1/0/1/-1/1/1/0/297
MSTVVVFACKSNSCRSQMAEGWARTWIDNERAGIANRKATRSLQTLAVSSDDAEFDEDYDNRLLAFLDGLLVLSVALDESAIISSHGVGKGKASITRDETLCVTCDGEVCASEPRVRKAVKAKAIKAMAEDGVDISAFFPKSIHEVTPQILHCLKVHRAAETDGGDTHAQTIARKSKRRTVIDLLEMTSTEMVMAYAGLEVRASQGDDTMMRAEDNPVDVSEDPIVDNLIVLCSCSSLKRKLSNMSKHTFDWDIDAPTEAAKAGEGDAAYVRVSRQIRDKVDDFLSCLKNRAMTTVQ